MRQSGTETYSGSFSPPSCVRQDLARALHEEEDWNQHSRWRPAQSQGGHERTEGVDGADDRKHGVRRVVATLVPQVDRRAMHKLADPLPQGGVRLVLRVRHLGEDERGLVRRKRGLKLGRAFAASGLGVERQSLKLELE